MKLQQQQPQIDRLSSWHAAELRLIERIDKSPKCVEYLLIEFPYLVIERFLKKQNCTKKSRRRLGTITTANTFAFMAVSR